MATSPILVYLRDNDSLMSSVQYRCFIEACDILSKIPRGSYRDMRSQCMGAVRRARKHALLSREVKPLHRAYALIFYLNIDAVAVLVQSNARVKKFIKEVV